MVDTDTLMFGCVDRLVDRMCVCVCRVRLGGVAVVFGVRKFMRYGVSLYPESQIARGEDSAMHKSYNV